MKKATLTRVSRDIIIGLYLILNRSLWRTNIPYNYRI